MKILSEQQTHDLVWALKVGIPLKEISRVLGHNRYVLTEYHKVLRQHREKCNWGAQKRLSESQTQDMVWYLKNGTPIRDIPKVLGFSRYLAKQYRKVLRRHHEKIKTPKPYCNPGGPQKRLSESKTHELVWAIKAGIPLREIHRGLHLSRYLVKYYRRTLLNHGEELPQKPIRNNNRGARLDVYTLQAVIYALLQGYSVKAVAQETHVTESTVRGYRKTLEKHGELQSIHDCFLMEDVARVLVYWLMRGLPTAEVSRKVGVCHRTACEYRKVLKQHKALPPCICGRISGHYGTCFQRLKNSPKLLAYHEGMRKHNITLVEKVNKAKRLRIIPCLRVLGVSEFVINGVRAVKKAKQPVYDLQIVLDEAKKRYRVRMLGEHPDKNPDNPEAQKITSNINESWEFILKWFKYRGVRLQKRG